MKDPLGATFCPRHWITVKAPLKVFMSRQQAAWKTELGTALEASLSMGAI